MIIEAGSKLHVIYRAFYSEAVRRHFLGEVKAAEGAVCRLEGYAFILDDKSGNYERRPERRTTIMDLGESGYVVNLIDRGVNLDSVSYRYKTGVGTIVTDGEGFSLNINEYGTKR